jgi:hypothetical protein
MPLFCARVPEIRKKRFRDRPFDLLPSGSLTLILTTPFGLVCGAEVVCPSAIAARQRSSARGIALSGIRVEVILAILSLSQLWPPDPVA